MVSCFSPESLSYHFVNFVVNKTARILKYKQNETSANKHLEIFSAQNIIIRQVKPKQYCVHISTHKYSRNIE